MSTPSVLWRRIGRPGHEAARLFLQPPRWHLVGASVFVHDQEPCRLDYGIICTSEWKTLSGKVSGWVGSRTVEIEVSVDSDQRWRRNGADCPSVTGCIDLDLNFSPSTNLLPIRRLNLSVGQEAKVRAAWLRFPSFALEPLEQLYRRVDDSTYHYESAGGKFVAELKVNEEGFVTQYADFWRADAVLDGS